MKLHSDSESLLSDPASSVPGDKIDRASLQVEVHETFDVRKTRRQFSCQYAHSYAVRLWAFKAELEREIKSQWPGVDLKKIAELCEFSQANANSAADDKADRKLLNGGDKKARDSEDHGQHIAFREDITVGNERRNIMMIVIFSNINVCVCALMKTLSKRFKGIIDFL